MGQKMRMSRTAIWKQIKSLEGYGLDIYCVRGKGYRLSQSLELLNKKCIERMLPQSARTAVSQIAVLFETDSTNQQLLNKMMTGDFHACIVITEFQSAGRGRRGRSWLSPLGGGISLSLGWHIESQPETMAALSLAAGVAIVKALKKHGIASVSLKWPNDIMIDNKKLGGILLEARSEMAGPCDIVLGIGINYSLPVEKRRIIDQAVTDLCQNHLGPLSRNEIIASIIAESISMLKEFSRNGFESFIDQWREYDYFSGKKASILLPDRTYTGEVIGVNSHGMLQMDVEGRVRQFSNGDLSLRAIT